jgi:hypothetical protein
MIYLHQRLQINFTNEMLKKKNKKVGIPAAGKTRRSHVNHAFRWDYQKVTAHSTLASIIQILARDVIPSTDIEKSGSACEMFSQSLNCRST